MSWGVWGVVYPNRFSNAPRIWQNPMYSDISNWKDDEPPYTSYNMLIWRPHGRGIVTYTLWVFLVDTWHGDMSKPCNQWGARTERIDVVRRISKMQSARKLRSVLKCNNVEMTDWTLLCGKKVEGWSKQKTNNVTFTSYVFDDMSPLNMILRRLYLRYVFLFVCIRFLAADFPPLWVFFSKDFNSCTDWWLL